MIQPRKSDGIVDLADLFPTALDLAGHLERKWRI